MTIDPESWIEGMHTGFVHLGHCFTICSVSCNSIKAVHRPWYSSL